MLYYSRVENETTLLCLSGHQRTRALSGAHTVGYFVARDNEAAREYVPRRRLLTLRPFLLDQRSVNVPRTGRSPLALLGESAYSTRLCGLATHTSGGLGHAPGHPGRRSVSWCPAFPSAIQRPPETRGRRSWQTGPLVAFLA